jgi:quinol monooxygenase YgiN
VTPPRRDMMLGLLAMAAMVLPAPTLTKIKQGMMEEIIPEYGIIGQIIAQPGQRAVLAKILAAMNGKMEDNFLYLVGEDAANADALWVVELWLNAAAHQASLQSEVVRAVIAQGRPMIAGFGARHEFGPVLPPLRYD